MIDFEWYRSFVAVYHAGTVSAGAERRLMTQPAITQHLAGLERALEVKLFQRTPRQMIPTAEGKALYAKVIGAVEQLEAVSDPYSLHAESQPIHLKIGTPREYFTSEMLRYLATYNADVSPKSHYQLHVQFGQTAGLLNLLDAEEIDAMIATQQAYRRGIHYVPLHVERFLLVGASNLEPPTGADVKQFTVWLSGLSWLAYAPDLPIIRRYWQDVFQARPTITPSLTVPDLLSILRAVTLGLGVSILPDYLCQAALNEGAIRILWQPERTPENTLYLAMLRRRTSDPAILWLSNTLGIAQA
jgi:DNA-binding transcriptional LysR family regulator